MKTFDELIFLEMKERRHLWRAFLNDDPDKTDCPLTPDEVYSDAFHSAAKFVHDNPMMIESVRELVEAAQDAIHSLQWPDELNWGKGSIELLEKAIKNLEGANGK